jgi:stage II sporulation protein D
MERTEIGVPVHRSSEDRPRRRELKSIGSIFTDDRFSMLLPRRWIAFGLVLLLVGTLPRAGAADPGDSTQVRVRLGHSSTVESVELTVKEGPIAVHLPGGGPPVMRLQAGETTTLGLRQRDVSLRRGPNGLYATELRLRPAGRDAAWAVSFGDGEETRTYTGGLYLAPAPESGLLLVNRVPIEDYVASVVASEYGLDDREGTKAMAVVARTYGLFTSEKFGGTYDQADGTASQVYEGAGAVTEASRTATEATEGEVLTHDGTLIQAVYFSSSGGHTADNEDVWEAKKPIPYLRGRPDPYDSASPHHNWTAAVDRSALLQALTRHRGSLVEGFTIGDRTSYGRIKTINVLHAGADHTMNANAFRLVVNRGVDGAPLKSTWFDARRSGDRYVFEGRGFGHGVGLSQWGAHEMAEQGKDYRQILTYYYTDVEVDRLGEVDEDPRDAPVARTPTTDPETGADEPRIGW